jgi:hypothetical protein
MVLLEQFVILGRIAANTQHGNAFAFERLHVIAKSAGLLRATAGKVRRIKIDDQHTLPDIILGLPRVPFVVDALKYRRSVAHFKIDWFIFLSRKSTSTHGKYSEAGYEYRNTDPF